MTTHNTTDNKQDEALLPCPFCPAVPSKTSGGVWWLVRHERECLIAIIAQRDQYIHPEHVAAWQARSRASLAAVEGDAARRDPNAKLRDLITLVCDAAFACGECDERDDVNYKPLFEAEQVAIANLKNYVVTIRESRAQPLCAVHRRLEATGSLECEIGNDCVACSLNERRELLQLIAPFAAEGNTEDTVTVMRRVAEFYATHVGEGRVIVSYPAAVVSSSPAEAESEQEIRFVAAERVANAARQFCEELQEDAEGVPQFQLSELNRAIDAWEAYPDARQSFDDSQPILAALASLIEDQHATDHQRRVARLALTTLENRHNNQLTEPERNEVRRAIAESDIAGCSLENADIDALVDLFESWLERRAAASSSSPAEPLQPTTDPPRCPKCGYVMCQQFDSRPVNALADIVTPNGTYICYHCAPAEPEGEQKLITENPFEQIVERALLRAGHSYVTDHGGDSPAHLDFYLPAADVHIEVKTMHSERVAEQMSRASNVVVVQGRGAIEWLAAQIKPAATPPDTPVVAAPVALLAARAIVDYLALPDSQEPADSDGSPTNYIAKIITRNLAGASQLSANEQGLIAAYRENLCGDEECEGTRFSAALTVLKGAREHREVAQAVSKYMHECSELITAADLAATTSPEQPTGGFTCECCQRNMEVRINGQFCNECAGFRSSSGPSEDRARLLLAQIIHDLPTRRDWLDPVIEREARALIGSAATPSPETPRRHCSRCGEALGFSEGDPCDRCVTQTPVEGEARKCVKCGHDEYWSKLGTCGMNMGARATIPRPCGCKCEFAAAPVVAAGDDEGDRTRCASCEHTFCKECNECDECCKCNTEIPPRTVAERLAQHEHIDIVEGVLGGVTPLVSRRRIGVHHILTYLYGGESIADIADNYQLAPEAIKDAIAFAQDVYNDAVSAALRTPVEGEEK